jgi:hypothetical protein
MINSRNLIIYRELSRTGAAPADRVAAFSPASAPAASSAASAASSSARPFS